MIHCYKLFDYYIVLDSASGSIHKVDDVSYDAICLYEKEGYERARQQIAESYPDLSDGDISGLFAEILQLESQGRLFSRDEFGKVAEQPRQNPLKALCLNVSHMCNMRCSYCFAGSGDYGGEEKLMTLDTGRRAIDFLIENSGERLTLDVDFFGGEPLLNWDVVKQIVHYARSRELETGKKFRFTLTTNCLLIDDDVIEFTNLHMHNVVLSLDGRPEVNDAVRKLPGGATQGGNVGKHRDGSYSLIVPKIKALVEARGGKGYYIRSTFTRDNLDFTSDIQHIADLGFTELSMEPAVAKQGAPQALKKSDLPELFRQYELLAAEMLRRNKEGRGFTFYHYKLDLAGGPCVYKRIAGCGVGSEYLAVTPDGTLYPCHQFVGDESFKMGDILRGLINRRLRDEFAGCGIYSRESCKNCWARMYCSGGCAANAYYAAGSIDSVHELGCELFKKRMECAIVLKVAEALQKTS